MIDKDYSDYIVDRYFYESYRKLEQKKAKSLSYYIVRTFALLLTIPINHIVLQQRDSNPISLFTTFLIMTLAYTLLQTCFSAYFYCSYVRNMNKIIQIAIEYRHSFLPREAKSAQVEDMQQDLQFSIKEDILGLRVSSAYYDFQNMQKISDVSEQFKSVREINGCSMIIGMLEGSVTCFRILNAVFMFISIFVFAFGLTVGSIVQLNQTQHSLLQMVLISEIMFQPRVYAILLMIGLLPVGVLVMCVYCCCCGGRGAAKAKLPQKIKATPKCVSNCADCSICFQGIIVDEEVVVLPCSEMHVFHYACIEGWTKMKPNCPNCRHLLT